MMLSAKEVAARMCRLQEEVCSAIGYDHPADCFCGQGGFWKVPSYDGTIENGYRNDGHVLEFIEAAVRDKIKSLQPQAAPKSAPEKPQLVTEGVRS